MSNTISVDDFYSKQPAQPAQPGVPRASGTISLSDFYGSPQALPAASPAASPPTPAPKPPEPVSAQRARAIASGVAELVDLVYTGAFAMPLAATREGLTRVQRTVESQLGFGRGANMTRKEIGAEASADANRILGEYSSPTITALRRLGILKEEERTAVEVGFEKLMERVDAAATLAEQKSGGAVLKEDVTQTLNMALGALGVSGVRYLGNRAAANARARAFDESSRAALAESSAARQLETDAREAARIQDPVAAAQKAPLAGTVAASQADLARTPQERKRAAKTRRAEIEAAFAADPETATRQYAQAEGEVAAREAALARAEQQAALPPSGERTGSRDAVPLGLALPRTAPSIGQEAGRARLPDETPTTVRTDIPIFSSAEQAATDTGLRQRGLASPVPTGERGALAPVARPSLDTALEKVRGGRLFDLTPEERIALRGTTSQMDPKIVTAAAVGATGLGLAMMYEPSPEEAALAVGAGALVLGRGKGLSVADLRQVGDATPLGALLDQSATTLSTLERLPRNRFEFTRQQIEDLAKRQEVTALERDVLKKVLDEHAGNTITAKELMLGVKLATQDFELTPKQTDNFADYGLSRIDRADKHEGAFDDVHDPQVFATATANLIDNGRTWEVIDADGEFLGSLMRDARTDTPEAAIAELRAQNQRLIDGPASATTTIYQSPMDLGTANHFGDPNYFAHTRSFEEDGVRHVVELQSDLAQKAGKQLTPEEVAKLTEQLRVQEAFEKSAIGLWDAVENPAKSVRDLADVLESYIKSFDPEVQFDVKLRLGSELTSYPGAKNRPFIDKVFGLGDKGEYDKIVDEVIGVYRRADSTGRLEELSAHEWRWLDLALSSATRREAQLARERATSVRTKLEEQRAGPVRPMLKNWHKRVIREEIASAVRARGEAVSLELFTEARRALETERAQVEAALAAAQSPDVRTRGDRRAALRPALEVIHKYVPQAGSYGTHFAVSELMNMAGAARARIDKMLEVLDRREKLRTAPPVIRFADADTVAKVEGWPEHKAERQQVIDIARQRLARMERVGASEGTLESLRAQIADETARLPTGRFLPEHQGIYDRYAGDVTKFLKQLGAKHVKDEHGHGWWEVPLGEKQTALPAGGGRTQLGGVDPQLLGAAGVIAGTAAFAAWASDPENKTRNAVAAGALAGLALFAKSRSRGVQELADQTLRGVENLLGNISTDRAMTPAVLRRLTAHAMDEAISVHSSLAKISPFMERLDRLPADVQERLKGVLLTGRQSEIVRALGATGQPELLRDFNAARKLLGELGSQLVQSGRLKGLVDDYFPRIVTDLPGLVEKLGREFREPLEKLLDAAERRKGEPLTEIETSLIVNRHIEQLMRSQGGDGASFMKKRSIEEVTRDLAPFYADPQESLAIYVSSAARQIERAKFFGRDLVREAQTGRTMLDASIGNVVARELDTGNITPENYKRMVDLLRSRFGPGEQAAPRALAGLQNFTNISLLGNVFSGMMNLADIGGIAAQHGILPLAHALVKQVTGKASRLTVKDVGLAESIGAEFVHGTRNPVKTRVPLTQRTVELSMSKATDKVFKYSGFTAFDRVMKEVNLNAAVSKFERLARSPDGAAKIARTYGEYFTTDMPQLLSDLRAGAKTRLTTELAFRELSDAQPVTRVEMPKFWLDNPQLRFGYALKSFMIKQLNLIKKRGVDEIRKGNTREGMGFIIRYGLMAGAAGMTMDALIGNLLGRDREFEWGNVPLNALKNLGLSQYVLDKWKAGQYKEAIGSAVGLPVDPVLRTLALDPQAVRYFPLVGRFYYDRFMGGAEKANEAAARRAAQEERESLGITQEEELP